MPNQIIFVYDDRVNMPDSISSIVGKRNFGEILYKKNTLLEYMKSNLKRVAVNKLIHVRTDNQLTAFCEQLKQVEENFTVIHFYANHVVIKIEKFTLLIQKLMYCQKTSVNEAINPSMLAFISVVDYEKYIVLTKEKELVTLEDIHKDGIVFSPNHFLLDISEIGQFLSFFSGGFEARFFNQFQGREYILVKKSTDKVKMKKEHDYYHLLPDSMKRWFIMPYHFEETESHASYSMERLNVPDMALQWIHNSINFEQFKQFIDKIFDFILERPVKVISKEEYMIQFRSLYYDKVFERFGKLKTLEAYGMLSGYVQISTGVELDQIYIDYQILFSKMSSKSFSLQNQQAIGHGDLCFSNILYDKSIHLMKFIDTKGATCKEELWMDPYYDIAKLSHSILGNYDFINNNLFEIKVDDDCLLNMVTFIHNKTKHKNYFMDVLKKHAIDINLVRICELSLFLSMLPLHVDHPKKVLAFILRAIDIKKEIDNHV